DGRLPAAGGPDENHEFPVADLEVEVLDHRDLAVPLGDLLESDLRHGSGNFEVSIPGGNSKTPKIRSALPAAARQDAVDGVDAASPGRRRIGLRYWGRRGMGLPPPQFCHDHSGRGNLFAVEERTGGLGDWGTGGGRMPECSFSFTQSPTSPSQELPEGKEPA